MAEPPSEATTVAAAAAAPAPPVTVPIGVKNDRKPRSRILVAVDESAESMHALTWAIDNLIAPRPTSESTKSSDIVVLVHVQTQPSILVGPVGPGFYVTPEVLDSIRKNQDHVSRKVLVQAKAICDQKHVETETMVALGDPRDGICEAVEKLHPRYLVVGSHGYGTIRRTFLGSVSDHCAHHAKCPVVIVRKQAANESHAG